MFPITVNKICDIHTLIIERSERPEDVGATVREIGTLDYLVEFELKEEYPPEKNAAIAMQRIASRHPFTNGNKRTAFQVADFILTASGYYLDVDPDKAEEIIVKMAKYECDGIDEEIEQWIKRNLKEL